MKLNTPHVKRKKREIVDCQGFKNNQEMAVAYVLMLWEKVDFHPLIFDIALE